MINFKLQILLVFTVFLVGTLAISFHIAYAGTFPGANGKIAYDNNTANNNIYSANPDGTGVTDLTNSHAVDANYPSWSPDGTKIVFSYNCGSQTTPGACIVFAFANGTFWNNGAPIGGAEPSWSPDGTTIASVRYNEYYPGFSGIFINNVTGTGTPTRLIGPYASFPSWSPDGTKIAYTNENDSEIHTINTDGTGDARLTFFNGLLGPCPTCFTAYPNWSPDGKKIAFASNDRILNGASDIYTMNADGTGFTQITLGYYDSHPSWSPDGTKIAFVHSTNTGTIIDIMKPDGTGITPLTTIGAFQDPAWGPIPPTRSTHTTITPNPSSAVLSSTITFHARVADTASGTKTTPTGYVFWNDGGVGGHFSSPSCTLTTASSSASTCSITYTAPGNTPPVTITGIYSDDTTHKTSSGTSALTLTLRNTSTNVSPNPSAVVHGKKITFHARVSDTSSGTKSTPTGTVSWSDGGSGGIFSSPTCTLITASSSAGTCPITYTSPILTSNYTITGTYSGDSTHKTSLGKSKLMVS